MDWQNTPITDLPIVSTSSVTSDIFTATGFSIPSHQPPSTQFPPLSSPSKPTSSPRSPSTTAFFCHTCKKSFGAEATYVSHQKTARHITAVKELQRKYDTGNERKAKKVPVPTAAVEAARKVLYADSVASTDPALAATVYWSVANVLWSNNRVRETGECLFKLTSVLSHLQTNPAPPTGTLQPPVTLKPSQIVETLYLARIALARLMSIYDCDFAIAMYMDALEGKYRIPFHEMTEWVEAASFASLLTRCKSILESHVKPTFRKPSKRTTPDPSTVDTTRQSVALRKLQLILLEAMAFAVNVEAAHDAVVLGCLAATVAEDEGRWSEYVDVCVRIADMYTSMDRPWTTCDCLESSADAVRRMAVEANPTTASPSSFPSLGAARDSTAQHIPDTATFVDKTDAAISEMGLLCDALMMAIYTDDRVRMRRLETRIAECRDPPNAPEIEFLLHLARSSRSLDHDWRDRESVYAYHGLDLSRLPVGRREKVRELWRVWRLRAGGDGAEWDGR